MSALLPGRSDLPDSHLSVAFSGMKRGTPWFRQPNTLTVAPLRADCGRKQEQMSPVRLNTDHLAGTPGDSGTSSSPAPSEQTLKTNTSSALRYISACLEHLNKDVSGLSP